MDIKVNQASAVIPMEGTAPTESAGDGFKFALTSAIEDADLQQQIEAMLKDITKQGELIARHMDIRDMKKYRGQIKEFLNEILEEIIKIADELNLVINPRKTHIEKFYYRFFSQPHILYPNPNWVVLNLLLTLNSC